MTISERGVTQCDLDQMIFTPIELWEEEYTYYIRLIKVFISLYSLLILLLVNSKN